MSRAPLSAALRAVQRPMPLDAPVMTMVCWSSGLNLNEATMTCSSAVPVLSMQRRRRKGATGVPLFAAQVVDGNAVRGRLREDAGGRLALHQVVDWNLGVLA